MRVSKPSSIQPEEKQDDLEITRADTPIVPLPTSAALAPIQESDAEMGIIEDTDGASPILPVHISHSRRPSGSHSVESVAVAPAVSSTPIEEEPIPSEKKIDKSFVVTATSSVPRSPTSSKKDCRCDSRYLDFSNSRLVVGIAYAIWCVVLIANAYAIVMLLVAWAK
jgi:hypothetical protein